MDGVPALANSLNELQRKVILYDKPPQFQNGFTTSFWYGVTANTLKALERRGLVRVSLEWWDEDDSVFPRVDPTASLTPLGREVRDYLNHAPS